MTRSTTLFIVSLVLVSASAAPASDASPVIKRVAPSLECLRTLDGETLYRELCVACHGATAEGNGAAAGLLNPSPTDLTRLAAENGGTFPVLRVRHAISGQHRAPASDSEMPHWESILGADQGNVVAARLRVYNLVQYMRQIQADPPAEARQRTER